MNLVLGGSAWETVLLNLVDIQGPDLSVVTEVLVRVG